MRSVDGVGKLMCCAAQTSTDATARLGARLAAAGADIIMVAAPLAAEVTPTDVIRHFEYLASNSDLGIIVYNNPVFGRDLSPEDLRNIVALPQVVGVKQGTRSLPGFIESVVAVREASEGRGRVFAASDMTAASTLFAGADGLTSTNSWIFPDALRRIVESAEDGNFVAAAAIAETLEPYFSTVRTLGQPRSVKTAMQLRGFPVSDEVRLPYVTLDAAERETLRRTLEHCDASLAELLA
jgi:4-hydroxy-tetrahydrodipicolinate synthase